MPHYRYTAAQFVALLRDMPEQDRARVDERAARDLNPRYIEHGKPSCLVAYLLLRAGVSVATLKVLDLECIPGGGTPLLHESHHPFWRRFEPAARQLLEFVQVVQDYGRTWGEVAAVATEQERPHGWLGVRWSSRYPNGRPWLAGAE